MTEGFFELLVLLTWFSFSLLTIVIPFVLARQANELKVQAIPFFIPLVLSLLVLFLPHQVPLYTIFILVQTLPWLILSLLFASGRQPTSIRGLFGIVSLLLFGILAAIGAVPEKVAHFLATGQIAGPLLAGITIVTILAALYKISRVDPAASHINWTLSAALLVQATVFFPNLYLIEFVTFLAYFALARFFFHQVYSLVMARDLEAEKVLSQWNRAVQLEVNRRVLELQRANQHLLETTKTDHLTSVYNKAGITDFIEDLLTRKKTSSFSLILFDIDGFKQINDTKGHTMGDYFLQQVAKIAASSIRNLDAVGRYGGDEFLLVLPNTTLKDACYVGERLRGNVEKNLEGCTISAGIAIYPTDAATFLDLVKVADTGLYAAKEAGKNAVSYQGAVK